MGIKVDEALKICNIGAQMLRIAEKLEAGEINVEGEKMPLSEDFKIKLNLKYNNLKLNVDNIIEKMEK